MKAPVAWIYVEGKGCRSSLWFFFFLTCGFTTLLVKGLGVGVSVGGLEGFIVLVLVVVALAFGKISGLFAGAWRARFPLGLLRYSTKNGKKEYKKSVSRQRACAAAIKRCFAKSSLRKHRAKA